MRFAEYIWIDGYGKLRSKTKTIDDVIKEFPIWSFDGSSTNQASAEQSDCKLVPVRSVYDPVRGGNNVLVLCEVTDFNDTPDVYNKRARTRELAKQYKDLYPVFGLEQEYTMYRGATPLGLTSSIIPKQGPYYCGIGADEVCGRDIVESHMEACRLAGLKLSGVNAEVMPGQWEFQIGPADPLEVGDHLWLARYLLYRIAERFGVTIKLDPKPVAGLNGAGLHTNFSTAKMREVGAGLSECVLAAQRLGLDVVTGTIVSYNMIEGKVFPTNKYPAAYCPSEDYKLRLSGDYETCSYKDFKYGIGDRGASIRVPTHVKKALGGYIEDRRPCANADPYGIVNYILETTCGDG